MKIKLAILFTIILLTDVSYVLCQEAEITTFILIRHAEKLDDSSDPDLSSEGYERAERLNNMFNKAEIDAVYSTDLNRTRETVRVLAESKDLEIVYYDVQTPVKTAKQWINEHKGEIIIVSGHSNTTPVFANALLGRQHFNGSFDESDYGNLVIVTISGPGDSKLLHLRY